MKIWVVAEQTLYKMIVGVNGIENLSLVGVFGFFQRMI